MIINGVNITTPIILYAVSFKNNTYIMTEKLGIEYLPWYIIADSSNRYYNEYMILSELYKLHHSNIFNVNYILSLREDGYKKVRIEYIELEKFEYIFLRSILTYKELKKYLEIVEKVINKYKDVCNREKSYYNCLERMILLMINDLRGLEKEIFGAVLSLYIHGKDKFSLIKEEKYREIESLFEEIIKKREYKTQKIILM